MLERSEENENVYPKRRDDAIYKNLTSQWKRPYKTLL